MKQTDSALASRLMVDLAGRTGVASDAPPTRYLWIDAFAVLNALDLHCEIGEARGECRGTHQPVRRSAILRLVNGPHLYQPTW